jgi:SAM-dependent methyltransferase
MNSNVSLKKIVKDKYASLAGSGPEGYRSSCCSPSGTCGDGSPALAQGYEKLGGYNPDADLGLGCGLPVELAGLKPGDSVIDLGSGAGNDCFIARSVVGENGYVLGIDMTPEMIARAKSNAAKSGFSNMEFRLGELEDLPVADHFADVVVSNCVFNLVPDKLRAFQET